MPWIGLALFFRFISSAFAAHSGLLKVCGGFGPTEERKKGGGGNHMVN